MSEPKIRRRADASTPRRAASGAVETPFVDIRMNHLGALGLLAELSVYIRRPEGDEYRESIEQCLEDAKSLGVISSWRRILNRFEIEP